MSNENSISLNKFISSAGFCSRREADEYIEWDLVTINGKLAKKGSRVIDGDDVRVDGRRIKTKPKRQAIYIVLNKPRGVVCTTDSKEKNNIVNFIGHKERLFPIGRLDKMSEGLIFLTNDGDIVNKILRAGNQHEKEYHVVVDRPLRDDIVDRMQRGVRILGQMTLPCKVEELDKFAFKITLTQGLNRQIRRMCEHFGYTVRKLNRTRIMNVKVGKLKSGEWRYLTADEMSKINKMTSNSSKTN
jgi:23S rRNA pseudouridine2604 synthase